MQSTTTSSSLLITHFLNLVDFISDTLGFSVSSFVDLPTLRQLPSGTLGRAWADALDRDQLTPFTGGPRRKQLHDGVHVLTGYGTDAIGEAEVQAFLLGAKFRLPQVLLGLGTLRLIHRQAVRFPLANVHIRQRLLAAYRRGQTSRFDVDAWQPETQWEKPLVEVQAMLGL
jgi:ubiquinone biosynthesis protein COQ4